MNATLKILFLEHDLHDLELLHHELEVGGIAFISQVAYNEPDYVAALESFKPDIILSDYTFPSFSGPAAFKIRQQVAAGTPFIFVSGTIGEENSIEYIKNGVTDYALKDRLFTLCPKITRAVKEAKAKQQKEKTENELKVSESRLARAQQVAHMGSWELDFSTGFVRWSTETCRIYGVPPDENLLSLESWLSLVYFEDVNLLTKKINESRELQLEFSINYRITHKNGSIRHIYTESKLEFDTIGKPCGLYGIAHDITERVALECALRQERSAKQSEITAAVLTAHEKERADIGKELNDNLNQILSATKMYIELAKTDDVKRQLFLEKCSNYIVTVMAEIRKISKALASPGNHGDLLDIIQVLIDDLTREYPIKIKLQVDRIFEKHLDDKLQLTIFRIVQQQVNNILQHSKATIGTIDLSIKNEEAILVISDNGKGSDTLKKTSGMGIKNIKIRAALHNGSVTVLSKPAEGYVLKVALPLTSKESGLEV